MKVIDAFSFFNEIDLIKLRLEYLDDVVDHFIVSECNLTHSGKPKPYYLQKVIGSLPAHLQSKIISVKYEPDISGMSLEGQVSKWDYDNDHWKLERGQRDFITNFLSHFSKDDLFLLGDVDEIPRKELVQELKRNQNAPDLCRSLTQDLLYYDFTTSCESEWTGTVVTTIGNAIEKRCDFLRSNRFSFRKLQGGGWHFSYFGGVERVVTKLESFAHQEYNREEFKDPAKVLEAIRHKKNILDDKQFSVYPSSKYPSNLKALIDKHFPEQLSRGNSIDLVIPTMWRSSTFIEALREYCSCSAVQKIILIDNNYRERPLDPVLSDPKIDLVCYKKNIYVNPAWNEGYRRSTADFLCLLNDDIAVEPEVFEFIASSDLSEIDLIGSYLKGTIDNFNIDTTAVQETKLFKLNLNKKQPIGGQSYAFGVCMFVKRTSYSLIPSLYKVWFGDDYIVQRCENVYALQTNKISGEISKTIVHEEGKGFIQSRIDLDTMNAYRYNHFMNGKNWDILKGKAEAPKTIFGY